MGGGHKLNVDDSSEVNPGPSGFGGSYEMGQEDKVTSFAGPAGTGDTNRTEVLAMKGRLKSQ